MGIDEQHEREQYFFDQRTLTALADFVQRFENPCLLCAPMLGREMHNRNRQMRVLDVDRRFADLSGFCEWDIYRPCHTGEQYDLILCDPPFFRVSLSQLFKAVRMLAGYDFSAKLLIAYLSRRPLAIESTFAPFGLKATGLRVGYLTVSQTPKNDVELFSNFDCSSMRLGKP